MNETVQKIYDVIYQHLVLFEYPPYEIVMDDIKAIINSESFSKLPFVDFMQRFESVFHNIKPEPEQGLLMLVDSYYIAWWHENSNILAIQGLDYDEPVILRGRPYLKSFRNRKHVCGVFEFEDQRVFVVGHEIFEFGQFAFRTFTEAEKTIKQLAKEKYVVGVSYIDNYVLVQPIAKLTSIDMKSLNSLHWVISYLILWPKEFYVYVSGKFIRLDEYFYYDEELELIAQAQLKGDMQSLQKDNFRIFFTGNEAIIFDRYSGTLRLIHCTDCVVIDGVVVTQYGMFGVNNQKIEYSNLITKEDLNPQISTAEGS